jgi:acyl carrier protein
VHPDAHLIDDLDLDSIDAIDLVVSLESETDLDVTEDELKALRVVQDIVDLVHRKLMETERDGA